MKLPETVTGLPIVAYAFSGIYGYPKYRIEHIDGTVELEMHALAHLFTPQVLRTIFLGIVEAAKETGEAEKVESWDEMRHIYLEQFITLMRDFDDCQLLDIDTLSPAIRAALHH